MPALRHDLSGSVFVLRMGLAVLKRKLEASQSAEDRLALQQRMESLDSSIADLSSGLRRLRHWDRQTEETLGAHALLSEVRELARPFLSLRGITLQPLSEASSHILQDTALRPQPLMYVLLATIYHLAEGMQHTPQSLCIDAVPDGFQIQGTGRAEVAHVMEPLLTGSNIIATPAIDWSALQCLGEHLGVSIERHAHVGEALIQVGLGQINPEPAQ